MVALPTPSAPTTSLEALSQRVDLHQYGSNALLLFALELNRTIEDIDSVAANSLTDTPDDKKCDLVYVDRDAGRAIVAQAYMAKDATKASAPSNKASDLNTAAAWLLSGELTSLPAGLQPAAEELRTAISDGVISHIEFWYCHNLPQSANVQDELAKVQLTVAGLLAYNYAGVVIEVNAYEVGQERLQSWYESSQIAVLVAEEFDIAIGGGFRETGDKWVSYCTSVRGDWLRDLFQKYKTRLFSANVRDYLGSIRTDRNINNNIKETARLQPGRFWAYNNGLTILVNGFQVEERADGLHLVVSGISIVNGAQTTGALSSVDPGPLVDAKVLARFVQCADLEVVRDVIRYNNSQNQIEAADFRSNDAVQERLRKEFTSLPDSEYRGGRRGSESDVIARPANLLPSNTVAQALAAFHGQPHVAYNERGRIWLDDNTYSRFFSEKTTARHIVLAYSLVKVIEESKVKLVAIEEANRTGIEKEQIDFYRQRGSIFLLVAALGHAMETFLGKPVPDRFALRFKDNVSPKQAMEFWRPLIQPSLAFATQLRPGLEGGMKNPQKVNEAISTFQSLLEAIKTANAETFAAFSARVELVNVH